MPEIREAKYPKLDYGWVMQYPKIGPAFDLTPTGKQLCMVHTVAVPPMTYIEKGCTGVSLSGNLTGDYVNAIPLKNRSTFLGTDFIRGPAEASQYGLTPQTPLREFTQQQCNAVVDGYMNARIGYRFLTSGAEEAYGADEPWKQEHHLQQSKWIEERFAQRSNAVGGKYYGTYDGHLQQYDPSTSFFSVFQSPQTALAYCKAHANFGNGFFSQDRGAYRNGLIKTYFMGGPAQPSFAALVNTYWLNNLALKATNWTTKVMAFGWNPFHEQEGYSRYYRHIVPSTGGYYESWDWPLKPFDYSVAEVFLSLMMLEGYYDWEAASLEGDDPNIIYQDEINTQYSHLTKKYYGPGNPQRGGYQQTYDPGYTYAYPRAPKGGRDAAFVAGKWYADAFAWAGGNWNPVQVKKSLGGAYYPIANTYPVDAWIAQAGYGFVTEQGTRSAIFYYNDREDVGSYTEIDFKLPSGSTITRTVTGGVPYLWFIDRSV